MKFFLPDGPNIRREDEENMFKFYLTGLQMPCLWKYGSIRSFFQFVWISL